MSVEQTNIWKRALRGSFLFSIIVAMFLSCSLDEAVEPVMLQVPSESIHEKEEGNDGVICMLPIEESASFPGGLSAWLKFLQNHLQVSIPSKRGSSGNVFLSFLVSKEGKVSEVEITRSVNASLDAAALALMQKSPDWVPARLLGQPVKSRIHIKIAPCLK